MPYVQEPSNEVVVHTQDFNGTRSTSQYWVPQVETDPSAGAPLALANGVQAITNNAVTSVEVLIHATNTTPGVAATGPYDRVQDKAKLNFDAADGSVVTLQLPGPKQTIFTVSNYEVDPADGLMAALIAALLANGRSAEGKPLVAFAGGYRRVPPRLKR